MKTNRLDDGYVLSALPFLVSGGVFPSEEPPAGYVSKEECRRYLKESVRDWYKNNGL
jgi:hypothetical protein